MLTACRTKVTRAGGKKLPLECRDVVMKCHSGRNQQRGGKRTGSTLAETLISMAIVVVTVAGTVNGYIFTTTRAEWSAYSLAAHSLAIQRLEQVRAAKWDTGAYPPVDRVTVTNFPPVTNVLDLPIAGTNLTPAICVTTIRAVSANPPFKLVQVDCSWPFRAGRWFTNTVVCYRAPDQ